MRKKEPNICFIPEDFYPNFIGGGGIYGYHLILGLSKFAKITILTEKKPKRANFWQKKNVNLILTPFCFGNQLILAGLQYLIFRQRLSKKHFNLLHATQLSGLFFVLFKPKNIDHIVITAHHTYQDMYQSSDSLYKRLSYLPLIFLERLMYQKAEAILFHTNFEREAVTKDYNLKKPIMGSIYLGVDLPKINTTKSKNGNEKVVLYVGRLVKRKKVETLLKALEILYQQGENVRGIIIGQGREFNNLIKIAPPNATLLGYVEDTSSFFLNSDLFVLTSVAEGGIALSVLEAASFGLPLIISPSVAGFPILKQGKNGYIVDPNDPRELAEKIKLVLTQASRMGKESRKIAKDFSWDKCIRQTFRFYQSLFTKR